MVTSLQRAFDITAVLRLQPRTSLSILTARVLPRLVTAWPGVVALAAMKAAIESVVPATTSHRAGSPNLNAVLAETCPTAAPGIATYNRSTVTMTVTMATIMGMT